MTSQMAVRSLLGPQKKTHSSCVLLMEVLSRIVEADNLDFGMVEIYHMVNTCSLWKEEILMVMLENQYSTPSMQVSMGTLLH